MSAVPRSETHRTGARLRPTAWLLVAILAFLATAPLQAQEGDSTTPSTATSSSAPTELTASVEQSGVVLIWTAPTLETDALSGYRVERRRVLEYETSWVTVVEHSNSLATSHTDATATSTAPTTSSESWRCAATAKILMFRPPRTSSPSRFPIRRAPNN